MLLPGRGADHVGCVEVEVGIGASDAAPGDVEGKPIRGARDGPVEVGRDDVVCVEVAAEELGT